MDILVRTRVAAFFVWCGSGASALLFKKGRFYIPTHTLHRNYMFCRECAAVMTEYEYIEGVQL